MDRVKVGADLLSEVENYCKSRLPHEACGVLYGQQKGEVVQIDGFTGLPNTAADPLNRFAFSAEDWCRIVTGPTSDKLIGLFHSHPTAQAEPSWQDRNTSWELPVYWIVSFSNPDQARWSSYRPQTNGQWIRQEFIITREG